MTYRRLMILYLACLGVFFVLVARVFLIANNAEYAATAESQTITTLSWMTERGNFYDCNGVALTGVYDTWFALCIPGDESYANLYDYVSETAQSVLYQNRNTAVPFLIEVEQDLTAQGIYTVTGVERYATVPLAAHLIGYVDQESEGVTGLESAFEEALAGTGEQSYLQCITTAEGDLMDGTEPILYEADAECEDIQLTLDKEIQRTAEGVASVMMEQGAIVVLEVDTAKVRASVSVPTYDPTNIAASLTSENGAFINRVFYAYSVGSVFKPVLAAAAIEQNFDWFTIECKGYVDINGQIYRCANSVAHGEVNLNTALEQSCNCYFIELGQVLGSDTVAEYGEAFGFGESVYLAETLKTAAGNMPDQDLLEDLGQLANVSFGQGALLATPLQVAAMMNTIVNDGVYLTPSYIEGMCAVDENGALSITKSLYNPDSSEVISAETAQYLQNILIGVVEEGIGGAAQPEDGTAGGKTGTAQTGRYDADGEEYKDLWFAGFYPADDPQYTIVIMQDDQIEATYSSAEIFAQVCEEIALLTQESSTEGSGAAEDEPLQDPTSAEVAADDF